MTGFMDIPPELREMIYEYAFTGETTHTKPIEILSARPDMGSSKALRATCTFVYHESRRIYKKVRKPLVLERQEAVAGLVSEYENLLSTSLPSPTCSAFVRLIAYAGNPIACKNHKCLTDGCYMCSSKAHQTCFDCGRNLAVALHCRLHEEDTPQMVIPESKGKPIPGSLGEIVAKLPLSHARKLTRDFETGEMVMKSPWAFQWSLAKFKIQRAVDLRCDIRLSAVKSFWTKFGRGRKGMFTDCIVSRLEKADFRMKEFDKIERTLGGGQIEWRAEYARRADGWTGKDETMLKDFVPRPGQDSA